MQSPPFGILGINNSNSCHAGNPPPKAAAADTGAGGQLPPIPLMNPSVRAGDVEEKEEKESESKQAPGAPRKECPTWETELTLLLTPMRPSQSTHG